MSIEWSDAYSIGIDDIDAQHKMFFGFVRGLSDHARETEPGFSERMLFLKQYALEHFDAEEKFMEQHGYPDFISHCQLHVDFIKRYSDLMKEIGESGETPDSEQKIFEMSRDWLIAHITKVDTQYAEYIRKKTAG